MTHARAGIYASLAGHGAGAGNCPIEPSEAASERFGIDVRNILVEVGKRGLAGGQEDMIVDVALELTTVCPS